MLAMRALEPGTLLEYGCYGARGRDQGSASFGAVH